MAISRSQESHVEEGAREAARQPNHHSGALTLDRFDAHDAFVPETTCNASDRPSPVPSSRVREVESCAISFEQSR